MQKKTAGTIACFWSYFRQMSIVIGAATQDSSVAPTAE